MKIQKLLTLTLLAALIAVASCAPHGNDRQIAVSIEPERCLLERIVGDKYKVVTLMDKGANPETFEPSMERRIAVDRSAAFLTLGTLPFERSILSSLDGSTPVYDLSENIELAYGTHGHGGHGHGDAAEHDAADPHIWTSMVNVSKIVDNMCDAMSEIDPENKLYYRHRADSLKSEIDSLHGVYQTRLEHAGSPAFAVWHPSLTYFARDYGLEQIAVGHESKEMSAARLREVIDHAAEDSVAVFFFQKEFDSRQAESINDRLGSRLVVIDPLGYDWFGQMQLLVDELCR